MDQILIPIPNQSAIFVGSSSAPQRTVCTPHRLNPLRLDFIFDLKQELYLQCVNLTMILQITNVANSNGSKDDFQEYDNDMFYIIIIFKVHKKRAE